MDCHSPHFCLFPFPEVMTWQVTSTLYLPWGKSTTCHLTTMWSDALLTSSGALRHGRLLSQVTLWLVFSYHRSSFDCKKVYLLPFLSWFFFILAPMSPAYDPVYLILFKRRHPLSVPWMKVTGCPSSRNCREDFLGEARWLWRGERWQETSIKLSPQGHNPKVQPAGCLLRASACSRNWKERLHSKFHAQGPSKPWWLHSLASSAFLSLTLMEMGWGAGSWEALPAPCAAPKAGLDQVRYN